MNDNEIVINDVRMVYSCPVIDIISHKYNFAIAEMSHYQDLKPNPKYDPKRVFGFHGTLELHRDAFYLNNFREKV